MTAGRWMEYAYVFAMGIDKGEDKNMEADASVSYDGEICRCRWRRREAAEAEEGDKRRMNMKSFPSMRLLFAAVQMLNTSIPRKLNFSYENDSDSEEVAKAGEIGEMIVPIVRKQTKLRRIAHIVVCKGSAVKNL